MADLPISGVPAAAAALTTHMFPVNEAGTTKSVTGAQLASMAAGVVVDTYQTTMLTNLTAGPFQTATLGSGLTSWSTLSRAAGLAVRLLIKALVDGVFARSSVAYDLYTGVLYGAGVARYSQPQNNLFTSSEDFTNAAWVKAGCSVKKTQVLRSDGVTAGAQKLISDASTAVHTLTQSPFATGVQGVQAWDMKADEYGFGYIQFNGGLTAWFNLTTGAPATVQAGITASVSPLGGGWYRCIAVKTAVTAGATAIVGMSNADNVSSFAGTLGAGIYIDRAQAEVGTVATGYNATGTTYPGNGLVAEEGTTNLVLFSDPTNTSQSSSFGNVSIGAAPTPAFLASVAVGDNSVTRYFNYLPTLATTTTYTISAIVTMDDGGIPAPSISDTSGDFELVLANTVTTSIAVESKGGGLYRVYGSLTTGGSIANASCGFVKRTTHTARTFKITRFQVEAKAYPTSGILTTGSTVTRAAETQTIPGSYVNPAQGAIGVEAYVSGDVAAATSVGTYVLADINDGTTNNRVVLFANAGTPTTYYARVASGGTSHDATYTAALSPGWYRFIIRWNGTNVWLYAIGIQRMQTAAPAPVSLSTTLYVGLGYTGGAQWNNPIRWLAIFKTDPGDAASCAYTNPHDPSVPARLNTNADYFVDFSANGGNMAPARNILLNPAWHVVGPATRPVNLPSGKVARLALECFGTTEADIVAHWNAEAA